MSVLIVASLCAVAHRAVAIVVVVVASRHRRRRRAINVLESIRGHPILVWGSPFRFGDPQTKTGNPESPYQNGDPRTNMGM